jgi:ATP-dependent protease ClpP protease subunit
VTRRAPLVIFGAGQQAPQYRFWGSRKPPAERAPVRAQVTSTDDGAGTATIRIYDPIDSWGGIWGVSASEFADALDALDSSVSQINLRINSPGGEAYEGIAILNLLRQHSADVTAYVDGLAASAASFLACGVDDVVMGQNSQMMIHDAWGLCVGPAADMHQTGDLLDKISNNVAAVYESKAGGTLADWRSAMLAETWYDAQEAVDVGLADRVDGTESDDAKNAFDLSMFKHKGRADAPAPATTDDERPEPIKPDCTAAAARNRHLRLRETQPV